jgi:hypothetical protein
MIEQRRINDPLLRVYTMIKSVFLVIPLFLVACALPREPEERWAKPESGRQCERYAGGGGPGPSDDALSYYDRQGGPYFAGPRLGFRDPYFRPADPLKEDAVRECLEREGTG